MLHNKLEDLDVNFQPIAKWIIDNVLIKYNQAFLINETRRDDIVQIAYYAQGRESLDAVNTNRKDAGLWPIGLDENKNTVTNMPHTSTTHGHGIGLAMDLVPSKDGSAWWGAPDSVWNILGKIVEDVKKEFEDYLRNDGYNIQWGGNWTAIKDTPHIEMIKN
jgi:hypothetical protein